MSSLPTPAKRLAPFEFWGRIDQQVKLQRLRIDLGEIEATILRHAAVEQAVVLTHSDHQGKQRLRGYVVKHPVMDTDQVLRAELYALLHLLREIILLDDVLCRS